MPKYIKAVDEIVKALRCVQEKHRNDRLLTFQTDVSAMARDAADMIESLQAEVVRFNATLAREGFNDIETMIAKYKTVMLAANELSIETDEEMEALREQLKASQRRAQDARNELCLKCGKYKTAHEGSCDGCRWKEK